MYRTELALRGKHNEYNSMAAGLVAKIFDIRQENLRESLSHFEGIEHRLEPVATVKGVDYINDSKATNVNSTWYALESMDKPVVWIVGGVDKGNDYEPLIPLVKDKVKAIVCLGEDVLKIHEAFRGCVETIINTGSMQEAVTMSSHFSSRGDVVLLSPCCASFDLFQNYEDRGRQFKFHVRNL
jgi:UDP-N-acetylmuramoylalanine--D-glutamate ligase